MSTISIIGSGSMAAAIGGLAAKAGHTVEVMTRDAAKARALVKQIGAGATTGTFGAAPAGDNVILAVPYPGDGANVWPAVHARDLASLFCLALEKGPAGKYWHGIEGEGYRFREIAEAIGSRLGLPAVSIPVDALMLPGYFGFFTNLVTLDLRASNAITRQALGWKPVQPGLFDDLGNGHYFPAR